MQNEYQQGSLILHQTEDNQTHIEVRLIEDNVWMTQAALAELFQTTPQKITLHLKGIFNDGELSEEAACKEYLQVQIEGSRKMKLWNLTA